jgi:Fur family ferric uptake transcriptional regulator
MTAQQGMVREKRTMARKTPQRLAILKAIEEEDRPLRVSEILDLGREDVPSLDQATVYRNLNRLVDEGAVLRINHPALGALYERTGKKHHHHFHCRVCDRLLELPGCAFDEKRHTPKGFKTESHELFLYGVCSGCSV